MHSIIITALLFIACVPAAGQKLSTAIEIFRENRIEESVVLFEEIIRREPANDAARAWLALNYRYLGRTDEAAMTAHQAIGLGDCNAMAHTVLADLYRPIAPPGNNDVDSTWWHLMKAIACDSNSPGAWMTIWTEAIRREDSVMELRSLERLYHIGFFTRSTLALARWQLNNLPEGALILTSGDLDTYPLRALQVAEGLRNDVAVVSLPLLQLPWYRRFVRDRHHLPLPMNDTGVSRRLRQAKERAADPSLVEMDTLLLNAWIDMARAGRFPRPLALWVVESYTADHAPALILMGPYLLVTRQREHPWIDTASVRQTLFSVKAEDFRGPTASAIDPSPIRASSAPLAPVFLGLALDYATMLEESGRRREAIAAAEWAVKFCRDTRTSKEICDACSDMLKDLKKKR